MEFLKLSKQFSHLRGERAKLEAEWKLVDTAIRTGKMNDYGTVLSNLMNKYQKVEGDVTYAALFRQSLSEKIAILRPGFFRLEPRGKFNPAANQTDAADALTDYIQQKFDDPNSGFMAAVEAAVYQAMAFNFGILHVGYAKEYRPSSLMRANFDINTNNYVVNNLAASNEQELFYQGCKITCLNLFDFYLDITEPNLLNIDNLDTYHCTKQSVIQIKGLLNKPSINAPREIYRGMPDIARLLDKNSNHPTVPVVECYLKSLTYNNKEYQNVHAIFVDGANEPLPILIETCYYPFTHKPYCFIQPNVAVNDIYAKSQTHLAFNSFARAAFYSADLLYQIAEASHSVQMVPQSLIKATTNNVSKFKTDTEVPGAMVPYNDSDSNNGWNPATSPLVAPFRQNAIDSIPLIYQAIELARQDMQTAQVDLQSVDYGESTATGVKAVTQRRETLQSTFLLKLGVAMKKLVNLVLCDLETFLTLDEIAVPFKPKDYEAPETEAAQGLTIHRDQLAQLKYIEITRSLFDIFHGDAKIILEPADRTADIELYELAKESGSRALTAMAVKRLLRDDPEKNTILQVMQAEMEAQSQPDPMQQAAMEAEIQGKQAVAAKQLAEAENKIAQTDSLNLDTELKAQMPPEAQ